MEPKLENVLEKECPLDGGTRRLCPDAGPATPLLAGARTTACRTVRRGRHSGGPGLLTLRRAGALGHRGIACVWVVIVLLVLIGFVGLAIDTGFMVVVAQQLQIGADAAALAAAQLVRDDVADARLAAINLAFANTAAADPILLSLNDANAADGDIVVGRYDRDTGIFTPQLTAKNAVKVVARRTSGSLGGSLPLFFGPVFGFDTADIQRVAIAMIGGGTGAGLIALSPDVECGLEIYGSVTVKVNNGAAQINSEQDCASCFQGAMSFEALEINSVGGICITGGGPDLPPDLNTDVDPIPDPLADLPEPTWDPADDLGTISMTGGEIDTRSPGYYSGGISINNGELNLLPGIYIVDGAGLNVSGTANLWAEGVMIYITGTGVLDFSGTGIIHLTPPDPDLYSFPGVDTYEGIAIFQARDNTNPSRIIGTSLMDLEGTYYFPNNHLQLGGDAEKFGNQLIAWTIEIFGNGEITINYDGRNAAAGSSVFLVY